jgi:putative PIN family toxin of toxin-antitoxin system
MKVFFDTNVYVAEALLGAGAEKTIAATESASWRIYASDHVLNEVVRVLVVELGFSRRLACLSRRRIIRRATLITPVSSHHEVPNDVNDTPILRAAISASADYLVTNDQHLLALDPCEGLRIVKLADFIRILESEGLLKS